jgi:hypothetical protein
VAKKKAAKKVKVKDLRPGKGGSIKGGRSTIKVG